MVLGVFKIKSDLNLLEMLCHFVENHFARKVYFYFIFLLALLYL